MGEFELASGRALFLDEIGHMPMAMQVKLFRTLDEGETKRLAAPLDRPQVASRRDRTSFGRACMKPKLDES